MTRPNTVPLMRTQKCACGETHTVTMTLVGCVVVECPEVQGHVLNLERMAEFPHTWYLRTGVRQ